MSTHPLADLAFCYASLWRGIGVPSRLPSGAEASEAYVQRVRRMAEQVHGMAPEARGQVLRILRLKSATVPWSALHPSWLADLMRTWPVPWRLWTLESLPPNLRSRLQKIVPTPDVPVMVHGPAPAWWSLWLSVYAKTRWDYPDLPPWEKASLVEQLPGSLWEADDRDGIVILRFYGTWGLVNCLRKMSRPDAQALIWQLPIDLQGLAMELAQARKWSDDPFWLAIYAEWGEASTALTEEDVIRMGLADWIRVGLQQGQEVLLRRLAYRLPRSLGEWALRQMETRPDWVNVSVRPDPEGWRQQLWELIQELSRQGRIHLPTDMGVAAS